MSQQCKQCLVCTVSFQVIYFKNNAPCIVVQKFKVIIISFYRGYRSSVIRAHCWAKKASALFRSELALITAAGLVTGSLSLCTKSTRGNSLCSTTVSFFVGDKSFHCLTGAPRACSKVQVSISSSFQLISLDIDHS